ncbi:PREDICTED: receptor activity-modifying protein 3-like [Branchiostoma belcheri]|uniref:Receptor activity-modifying protein 3-like n=1 Tax=Branchiostoma belcheri TaxID=7741 RepID=A0A6P4YAD6_BRABE|nr:PREDICTED: receptor activity-modifying protein 3-like [Branchiostoma belcheri]
MASTRVTLVVLSCTFVMSQLLLTAGLCPDMQTYDSWMAWCEDEFTYSVNISYICDWDQTIVPYSRVTKCAEAVSLTLNCTDRRRLFDVFMLDLHRRFFANCTPPREPDFDAPDDVFAAAVAIPTVLVWVAVFAWTYWNANKR